MENNSSTVIDLTHGRNSTLPVIGRSIQWTLGVVLAVTLALLMFCLGCSVQAKKVWVHLRHPWGVLVGVLCQFGVMPLMAYLLVLGFSVTPAQAVAIIILGSCPGGTISNILTYWLDGDMDLSLSVSPMQVSTLLGLGILPLCLYMYTHSLVQTGHIQIPYLDIAITSVYLIVPVSFGILFNYKCPKAAKILLKVGSILCGLVMLTVGVASVLLCEGIWNTDTSVIVIGSIFPLVGFLLGFVIAIMARQSMNRCRTIAVETGAQNVQLCGTVLQLFLPPEQLAVVVVLPVMYSCFQIVCGILLVIGGNYNLEIYIAFQTHKRISGQMAK